MTVANDQLIAITGGAGLVGQNLIITLREKGYNNLLVIDKNAPNLDILKQLHPEVQTINADLSQPGQWQQSIRDAKTLIMLQAQIGALTEEQFTSNTIHSTELVLDALQDSSPHLIHISSSVVNSIANDFYVKSKTAQEKMVIERYPDAVVLRPTLMFGWFDRKHLGWLSRFMAKTPIFPIPGRGRYLRQPLYAGDFCNIIVACIEKKISGQIFDISGKEKIFYVDIIKKIREITRARTAIVHIPTSLFSLLLRIYAVFSDDPPFTESQLSALVTDELFDVIDWDVIFSVQPTAFATALERTLIDSKYSQHVLKF